MSMVDRERLAAILKERGNPLVEGDTATFYWQGSRAPRLAGDFTGWDEAAAVKLGKLQKGWWTYQLKLPLDAYIEYNFVRGEDSIPDPYNSQRISNGMGGSNRYFHMPGYRASRYSFPLPGAAQGEVQKYEVDTDQFVFGTKRTVYLYRPAAQGPLPLIVFYDAQDYLRRMRTNILLDNLIAEKCIAPVAAAFVNHGGTQARGIEYTSNDASLAFLMSQVLPLAQRELDLQDYKSHPGVYAIAGASASGLMAFYTARRLPHVFGKVLSQSGAFAWGEFDMVVFDLYRQGEIHPLKIWMDAGLFDLAGLLDANRRMRDVLAAREYEFEYKEFSAGHNIRAWKNELPGGLQYLFGTNAGGSF